MRVTFREHQYIYKGDSDSGMPLFEKRSIAEYSGSVVSTVVMDAPDTLGNSVQTPHFVVALDDGTFKVVPIYDCTIDKDNLFHNYQLSHNPKQALEETLKWFNNQRRE